jgi:hypothetical protein
MIAFTDAFTGIAGIAATLRETAVVFFIVAGEGTA